MTGSEKQIAWAEDIVSGARKTIESNINLCKQRMVDYPSAANQYSKDLTTWEAVSTKYEWSVNHYTAAKDIIDHRNQLDSDRVLKIFNEVSLAESRLGKTATELLGI